MGPLQFYAEEAWIILRLLLPQLVQIYFTMGFSRMTLAFVGHFDAIPAHIGGAALGTMYSNITGMSIGVGATLAVNAFCSQNAGRGASTENGIVLRHAFRGQLVSFAFALVAALLSRPILGALQQPEELLTPCMLFSLIQAFGLLPAWLNFSINSALTAQMVQVPGVVISVCNSITNVLLTWGLLASGMGYLGVAVAFTLSNWIGFIAFATYVVLSKRQGTVWRIPANPDVTISFRTYVDTGLPSAASMWVEWWAAEILAIFAGLLPSGQYGVAANGILFNTLAIVYFTYVSTQVSTGVRIGTLVGARDAARIPSSLLVAVSISMLLSIAGALVLEVFGLSILRLYTSDDRILSVALTANPGIVLSVPPYAVMMCLLGAMRSAGLQSWAASAIFVAFYVFGIPTGAYLGLVAGWGLLGVWMGNVVALSLATLAMSAKVCNVDWLEAVNAAMAYEAEAVSDGPLQSPQPLTCARLGAVRSPIFSGGYSPVSRSSSTLSGPLLGGGSPVRQRSQ